MITYTIRAERLKAAQALNLDEVFLETEKDLVEMAWSCLMERVLASPGVLERASTIASGVLGDLEAIRRILQEIRLEPSKAA